MCGKRAYDRRMMKLIAATAVLASIIAGCGGVAKSSQWTEGRDLYANNCSVCHGSTGEGSTAPSLRDVEATFPSCDTHIEWVTLGSEGWKLTHGDTYGSTHKPITAAMPAHGERLTPTELALVASFERIQYGGLEEAAVFSACGLDVTTSEVD